MLNKHRYEQDLELARQIGRELTARVDEQFHSMLQAAVEFQRHLSRGAYPLVREYCSGTFVRYISTSVDRPQVNAQRDVQLDRLAIFYETLQIPTNDPIVEFTREINPAFEYPSTIS